VNNFFLPIRFGTLENQRQETRARTLGEPAAAEARVGPWTALGAEAFKRTVGSHAQ